VYEESSQISILSHSSNEILISLWDRVCSQIFKCSSSKLGLHHDLTLNKFECTPFKAMINLYRGSIYFKIIDQGVEYEKLN
jgi:hypothetical protein